jgi:hypothetical protein
MTTDYEEMAEAFADLADVIGNQIWWYQGGANEALRALLRPEYRERLLLLMGDNSS